AGGERRFLERIDLLARLLGRRINGDHLVAAFAQRLEHRLAERLLAVHHDPHRLVLFPLFSSLPGLTPQSVRRVPMDARVKPAHDDSEPHAASARPFSGAVMAPEALISPTSLPE